MATDRYSSTERVGINAVESIVLNQLEWIFREQLVADMGIDAQIELVDGTPTGKLIAVQIKTGASHFHETGCGYTYYGDGVHLDYWSGHSLPIILVAHLPETEETFWVSVNESSVQRTKKGWKVNIPKANVFGSATRSELMAVFDGTPAQQ
jgi:hypothetical protein